MSVIDVAIIGSVRKKYPIPVPKRNAEVLIGIKLELDLKKINLLVFPRVLIDIFLAKSYWLPQHHI